MYAFVGHRCATYSNKRENQITKFVLNKCGLISDIPVKFSGEIGPLSFVKQYEAQFTHFQAKQLSLGQCIHATNLNPLRNLLKEIF